MSGERTGAAGIEPIAQLRPTGGVAFPAKMHLAAKQESRYAGGIFHATLLDNFLKPARVVLVARDLEFMQRHPWPRHRDGSHMRMRGGAVRAGQRPEEIQLHLWLTVHAGLDPGVIGKGSQRPQ